MYPKFNFFFPSLWSLSLNPIHRTRLLTRSSFHSTDLPFSRGTPPEWSPTLPSLGWFVVWFCRWISRNNGLNSRHLCARVFGTTLDWLKCLPQSANANCNQEKNPELTARDAETNIRTETWGKTRYKKSFKKEKRNHSVSEANIIRSRWVRPVSDELRQRTERPNKVKFWEVWFYWVLPPCLSLGCSFELCACWHVPFLLLGVGGILLPWMQRTLWWQLLPAWFHSTTSTTAWHYCFCSRRVSLT